MLTNGVVLVLSCLGVAQGLFLCVYLFTLKEKRASIFLAFVLLGITLRIGKSVLHHYFMIGPGVRNLGIAAMLMTGPFLWFYGQALFEKKSLTRSDYWHLAPFVLFVLFSWIIPNRADFLSGLTYSLVCLHLAIYLALCWRYALKVCKGARLFSWYRNIVAGVSVIWFLYAGIFIGFIPLYLLGAVFFSCLMYLFSFLLLKQHIFALEKYNGSAITPAASKQLLQQIEDLFIEKEIYLDSEVSVKVVAQNLSVNPRDVSQVINEHAQKNFAEFVNHYRIKKAKALLVDPDYEQEKIASIAYACGFGNVTSFNLVFKAETQLTPTQYKNQLSIV